MIKSCFLAPLSLLSILFSFQCFHVYLNDLLHGESEYVALSESNDEWPFFVRLCPRGRQWRIQDLSRKNNCCVITAYYRSLLGLIYLTYQQIRNKSNFHFKERLFCLQCSIIMLARMAKKYSYKYVTIIVQLKVTLLTDACLLYSTHPVSNLFQQKNTRKLAL